MFIINDAIKGDKFRITLDDGESKIMSRRDIWQLAENQNADIILINTRVIPPVVKIADCGKMMYERDKKNAEIARKNRQTKINKKCIKLTVRIEQNDFDTKLKHANEFLNDGDIVEISLKLKGREVTHKQLAIQVLQNFTSKLINKKTLTPITGSGMIMTCVAESSVRKTVKE
jgi:translation initiation factor IF-3